MAGSKNAEVDLISHPVSAPEKKGQQPKKKKKNAPDRPQPAWLFPPDEENPVLNPKQKTKDQKKQELEDRLEAISFLKHKSVGAPLKPQPPSQLLQLVAAFLASYGFNNSGRIFTLERQARKRVLGWDDQIGEKKFEKDMPNLVKIYKDWHDVWQDRVKQESSSSEDESEDSEAEVSGVELDDEDSDASSDDSDDSNKPKTKRAAKAKSGIKSKVSKKPASSISSESDAEDQNIITAQSAAVTSHTSKPAVSGLINKLKRKADSSESSSGSSGESSSESEEVLAKKAKRSNKTVKEEPIPNKGKTSKALTKASGNAQSLESSSSASSDSGSEEGIQTSKARQSEIATKLLQPGRQLSSESSATLTTDAQNTTSAPANTDSSETSDSDSSGSGEDSAAKEVAAKGIQSTKRKRSKSPKEAIIATSAKVAKRNNAPFQRVAADTKVDPKLASNAYVPYDYAQRAHQDLVVTRGKGFTKEKNKKKRGSYRGGLIDTNGGKGVKFED